MKQTHNSKHRLMVALLAGTAIGGLAVGAGMAADNPQQVVAPKPGAIQPAAPVNKLADFSDLVAQVKPAVVSITSKMKPSEVADMEGPVPNFPIPGFPFPGLMQRAPQRVIEARGSGFIIDPNGTIVTNNHVVKNAEDVSVTLDNGVELPAKVIGTDPRTDLAVLRVKADNPLPFINLGDSDQVRPGQWVIAVGNPFGLGGSVTAGIVSARGRDIGEGPYDSFIQVDAPINQGNSGGPLFTQDGKVVGVNTAILSPTGGSVGIGFAIPSDTVKTVVAQLESAGHVTRGYLGVRTQQMNAVMASALNLPKGNLKSLGALVAGVETDSPAQAAGLQPGDVIASVNGKHVDDPRALALMVGAMAPGEKVRLGVVRDGSSRDVAVKLTNMPEQSASRGDSNTQHRANGRLGLALAPLTPDLRQQLNLDRDQTGAVVATVQPGSGAAQAGLRQGDVVIGVGNRQVATPDDAVTAIRGAEANGHAVALRILRGGQSVFVAVPQGGDQPG